MLMEHTAWTAFARAALGRRQMKLHFLWKTLDTLTLLSAVHVWCVGQEAVNECAHIHRARTVQYSEQVAQHKFTGVGVSLRQPGLVFNLANMRLKLGKGQGLRFWQVFLFHGRSPGGFDNYWYRQSTHRPERPPMYEAARMTWLTAPTLAGLPGLPTTARGILLRSQADGWARRPYQGDGRPGHEFHVASLPPEAQMAIAVGSIKPSLDAMAAARQARQALQTQACAISMAQYGLTLEAAGGFDATLNPRLDLFQRFEKYHAQRGCSVWAAVCEFVHLWGQGLVDCHAGTRSAYPTLPAKTLDKWWRAWRTQGVAALLERKPRADKGQTRLQADDALYQAFISALAEMHTPTARQVRRVIANTLGDAAAPPLNTLTRWLRDFKAANAPALLMLKNPDGYKNKYRSAFGSQGDKITRPNQQWQQDSTVGDAQQRADLAFDLVDMGEGGTGEVRRHAIIASIDVFTRRAHVVVAPTSSANAVKAVTRLCMRAWGKPEQIKTDNGRDYTAQDYDFALQSLGVEHLLCTPFSPEQKPYIERFIGTLMHDLFPMLEGFVGKSVAERKAIESAKSFAQRFGLGAVALRMGARQLQDVINGWLAEYHSRKHSELGCTPNEMAERHVHQVVQIDERALDLFLMPVAGKGTRVVGKRGIPLDNAWFAAPELAAHIGSTVRCRQDELDLGSLHVFGMDGSYICKALDHSLLGINKGELAAKAHAIAKASIQPRLDEMRKALKRGLTQRAVQALYNERQDSAISAAVNAAEDGGNVHRLVRRVPADTPAVASYIDSLDTSAQEAARARARASMEADAAATGRPEQGTAPSGGREPHEVGDRGGDLRQAAPVRDISMAKPVNRYSAWVRLQGRMHRGEQLAQRELDWARSYQGSSEFESWHELHEGVDPLEGEVATG